MAHAGQLYTYIDAKKFAIYLKSTAMSYIYSNFLRYRVIHSHRSSIEESLILNSDHVACDPNIENRSDRLDPLTCDPDRRLFHIPSFHGTSIRENPSNK